MTIHLYSRISDKETVLELWGGSTKHPDVVYNFSDFQQSPYASPKHPEHEILPWILECASRLTFTTSSYALAYFGMKAWETMLQLTPRELELVRAGF